MSVKDDDLAWEQDLFKQCTAAAEELLQAAAALRWHSDDAVSAAVCHLERVAHRAGVGAAPPMVVPSRRRKKLPSRQVWNRDGWRCRSCGTHERLTVDHVIPLALGGTDDLENLQTLCERCNSVKGARI